METRKTRRIVAPVALVTGLVFALTACGGGGGSTADASGDGPTDDYTPGPLEKMWTEAYGDNINMDSSDMNAQQARMEQAVAECMSAEGWEYTPVDYSQMNDGITMPIEEGTDGPQWGTEEYAKELGYGISTWEDQGTETMESMPVEEDEWFDPNQEYIESLSETALESYHEALNGPQPTEEEMASGDWEWDPENSGCYGKASDEIYNAGGNVWEDEKFKSLSDEMSLLYTASENDPKVAAAKSAWSECMTEAGYPGLADPAAAQETIYSEINSYWEKGEEPDESVLAPLREKERAIATADFACSKESDIEKVQLEVQHQAEQDFIDAHRAELEELMAALKEQEEAAKG